MTGLAVITVMLVTTCLMSLVIVLCWNRSVVLALAFVFFFGTVEALFFSASLIKFLQGAWVPVALSLVFLAVMYVWHYGTIKTYEYDVQNQVSINWLLNQAPTLGIVRVRGIGLIHTELVSGIPAIFSHFVTNLPAFHQVLVFLCIKSVPVPHVGHEERFLVGRIGPRKHRIYRCIVRYGYRDVHRDDVEFERDLVCSVAEFIRSGTAQGNDLSENPSGMAVVGTCSAHAEGIRISEAYDDIAVDMPDGDDSDGGIRSPPVKPVLPRKRVRFVLPENPEIDAEAADELRELTEARESGIAYILGHCYVRAKPGSGVVRRAAIDLGYDFLRRNCRTPVRAVNAPRASTIEVGMACHI